MTTPIVEAALVAVAARLVAQIPNTPVERVRLAEVDTDAEPLPRLVLELAEIAADETQEPLVTHYTLSLAVTGYARATTGPTAQQGLLAQQAILALQAQVVAALSNWMPTGSGLGDLIHEGADITVYQAGESSRAAGQFTARFSMLCTAATGSPYA